MRGISPPRPSTFGSTLTAQPLIRFLTQAGIGSRRRCFGLITSGRVTVNGETATSVSLPVERNDDRIEIDGVAPRGAEPLVYLKLNKPGGVISTTSDDRGRTTVIDLVPERFRSFRLYPVGRLDADTTGLVILTNDGDLAYMLTHPRFELEKEYHALLDTPLRTDQRHRLERGVNVEGRRTAPARVAELRRYREPWYRIVVHEGRKRQVRHMFRAVGRRVIQLQRVRIHTLDLGDLPEGQAKELTREERRSLAGAQTMTAAARGQRS